VRRWKLGKKVKQQKVAPKAVLPDQILVVMEGLDDDAYPITIDKLEDAKHGDVVGVYELVRSGTVQTTTDLV
jgi:hypothetical protein